MSAANRSLNFSDSEQEDENLMTSKELLNLLETAWLNEKFAPDLLPHKAEIVDCMLDQLNAMQENLEKSKKHDIRMCIHKLEIERIRFILSSYLRQRLQKIEHFCPKLLEEEKNSEVKKMTSNELKFALEYQGNLENHFMTSAIRHMPKSSQNIATKEMKIEPNASSYVFMKINKSIDNVLIDDGSNDIQGETMDFIAGDQHIMYFKPLKDLLNSSHVSLL